LRHTGKREKQYGAKNRKNDQLTHNGNLLNVSVKEKDEKDKI
jgi:hypothetical protein